LVGAVGIENNNIWNFKDLEEMLGNAKALKRNNREYKEILIGPSMAPHFSGAVIPFLFSFSLHKEWRRLSVKSSGTDGKPTTTLFDSSTSILGASLVCFCARLNRTKQTN
jgi:hypothetical protein